MQGIVNVQWKQSEDGWTAALRLVDRNGFYTIDLESGTPLAFEIGENRICTGYADRPGNRETCPFNSVIDSGSQCTPCRSNDYYADYVTGQDGLDTADDFSVYLAQAGDAVKIGVTKSKRLEQRWVEQGADYAVELYGALNSSQALQLEDNLSEEDGIRQRIRKEEKAVHAPCRLESVMDEHGYDGGIVDVQDLTAYPALDHTVTTRTGRFAGEITAVKGQIISDGRLGLILSSGRVLQQPVQKGLDDF